MKNSTPDFLFYAPDALTSGFFALPDDEAHHALHVLRMKIGDIVFCTDGKGACLQAAITNANVKKCTLEVLDYQQENKQNDFYIHLAIAPLKNAERTEWLVEKCTEIGVDELSFLQTQRTERSYFNVDRVRKKAISAMKQSLKMWLPVLNEPRPFVDFVAKTKFEEGFIAYVEQENEQTLFKSSTPRKNYCVLVGPEGDFSPEELQIALQSGFRKVSLGKNRLRTETAGIVVCQTLQLLNES